MSSFDDLTDDIRRAVANHDGSTEIIKFIQKKLNDGLNEVVTKVRQIEDFEVPDQSYRMRRRMYNGYESIQGFNCVSAIFLEHVFKFLNTVMVRPDMVNDKIHGYWLSDLLREIYTLIRSDSLSIVNMPYIYVNFPTEDIIENGVKDLLKKLNDSFDKGLVKPNEVAE